MRGKRGMEGEGAREAGKVGREMKKGWGRTMDRRKYSRSRRDVSGRQNRDADYSVG